MAKKTTYIVQQAYSRKNSGDGLLVDLTLDLLKEAGVDLIQVVCFANDAKSFCDLPHVEQVECTRKSRLQRIIFSVSNLLRLFSTWIFGSNFKWKQFDKYEKKCIAIFGVGGGYLRGATFLESLKCLVNNCCQLAWASKSCIPVLYFPQSIGPFKFSLQRNLVERFLSKFTCVCVRDDRSLKEFNLSNIQRVPDLAVLEIYKRFIGDKHRARDLNDGKIVFVVRSLPKSRFANAKLIGVMRKVAGTYAGRIVFGLQSEGRGNDDARFYRKNFPGVEPVPLKDLLNKEKVSLVISVRLHGSLESILSGYPSIHLAYERKGFGAFEDLGIENYVSSAYSVDFNWINNAILEIETNRESYWISIQKSLPKVGIKREALIENIRKLTDVSSALESK